MRQKEISAAINKRFKKIERLFLKILSEFEIESIHEFRTEVKKLRAFLRLLNVKISTDNRLKISNRMKTFYSYAGTIRNLQLQLKNMHAFTGEPQYAFIETYIEYLKKIIEKWKENTIEFIGSQNDFYAYKEKVLKKLPANLSGATVKKFIQNKMNEMAVLLKNLPDDDTLHNIRKLLKDILYNWAFVKPYNKLLPHGFSKEKEIKSFTELLGLFLDNGMGIMLLETYCKDCEENGIFFANEISKLQEIESRWKSEKQELSKIIYLRTGLIKLLRAGDI